MKKTFLFLITAVMALSLFVSCGEDPFFHAVTMKYEDKVVKTVIVYTGEYTLPSEVEGIPDLEGWIYDGKEYDVGAKITVTGDIIITAVTGTPVVITLYGDVTTTIYVKKGQTELTLPEAPKRGGYDFDGWKIGEKVYEAETKVAYTEGMTIAAVWTKLYTVTYYNDAALVDTASFRKGEGITLKTGEGLSKGELGFAGWSKENNAEKADFDGGAVYNEDKDITLYAVWGVKIKKLTYVLTDFDGNYKGGAFKDSSAQTVIEDVEKVTLPAASALTDFTGAEFDGWYTAEDKDGNRTYYKGGTEITITGDITLYAHWTDNNLTYTPSTTDSTASVSSANNDATEYKISEWYQGKKVTVIASKGFQNNKTFTTITIPKTIETIGWEAFAGQGSTPSSYAEKLTTIIFAEGSSLKTIGRYAFAVCKVTTNPETGAFVLPASVKTIERYAFQYNKAIKSVTIPAVSETKIESQAFYDCTSLESITIGSGITSIESNVFMNCSKLKSITIQKSASEIQALGDYSSKWGCSGATIKDASGNEVN